MEWGQGVIENVDMMKRGMSKSRKYLPMLYVTKSISMAKMLNFVHFVYGPALQNLKELQDGTSF